jgi:simple sugar transport system permease protein
LAIIVTIFAVVLLTYTTFGKKIINTGMSVFGAQYVGYSVKLNQVLAMSISGMIAGILGMMVYLGNATTMPIQVAAKSIPQQGFSGISVGLIAMSNPWAILPISCLFGMIDGTKAALSTNYGIDPSISDAIFGIIVYGAAVISIFYFLVPFKWYLRIFRGKVYADNYQNYINSVNQDLDDASTTIYYLKHKNLSPDSDYCFDQQFLVAKMKKFGIRCSNQKITKNKYRFYRHQIYQKYQQLRLKNKQFFLKRISVRLNKNNPNKESIV